MVRMLFIRDILQFIAISFILLLIIRELRFFSTIWIDLFSSMPLKFRLLLRVWINVLFLHFFTALFYLFLNLIKRKIFSLFFTSERKNVFFIYLFWKIRFFLHIIIKTIFLWNSWKSCILKSFFFRFPLRRLIRWYRQVTNQWLTIFVRVF